MSKFAKKHAPEQFNDLVFAQPEIGKRLQEYASCKRTKPIILHGTYGGGKSTIAKLLVRARDPINRGFWQTINCSCVEAGFLKPIEGTWRFAEWLEVEPMCILEEADLLRKGHQFDVRAFIDQHGGMLVMTTNHLHAIDTSIRSRCDCIEIEPPEAENYLPVAQKILSSHGIVLDQKHLLRILGECINWRDVLGALEDLVQGALCERGLPAG